MWPLLPPVIPVLMLTIHCIVVKSKKESREMDTNYKTTRHQLTVELPALFEVVSRAIRKQKDLV